MLACLHRSCNGNLTYLKRDNLQICKNISCKLLPFTYADDTLPVHVLASYNLWHIFLSNLFSVNDSIRYHVPRLHLGLCLRPSMKPAAATRPPILRPILTTRDVVLGTCTCTRVQIKSTCTRTCT